MSKEPRRQYWIMWYLVVAFFLLAQVLVFWYITNRFAGSPF